MTITLQRGADVGGDLTSSTATVDPPVLPGTRTRLSRVAWTRGDTTRHLAEALSEDAVIAARADLKTHCLAERIDLLVARRFTSFDLVPTLVPHDVSLDQVRSITAAVCDGPHSSLVAAVAARLSVTLDVPAELVTVYRDPEELPDALARMSRFAARHPGLGRRIAQSPTVAGVVDTLNSTTLLIVGAPGGSWIQRQLHGPGHRMVSGAPGGVVVVRDAPRSCFHETVDPAGVALGAGLAAEDARRIMSASSVPVADEGRLVGILRADALTAAPDGATVEDLMEPPVAVLATESIAAVDDLWAFLDGGPVPVVDGKARLVGVIPRSHLEVQ